MSFYALPVQNLCLAVFFIPFLDLKFYIIDIIVSSALLSSGVYLKIKTSD